MGHLQNLNRDLANRLIELNERLGAVNEERDQLNSSISATEVEFTDAKSTIAKLQKQLQIANEELAQMRQKNDELSVNYENLNCSTTTTIETLTKEHDETMELLKDRTNQLESMREQLVKNADLLISPEFRGKINCANFKLINFIGDTTLFESTPNRSNSNLSSGEMQLLLEQQNAINELRRKLERLSRTNDQLQGEMSAQQLSESPSFKTHDLMKIQVSSMIFKLINVFFA